MGKPDTDLPSAHKMETLPQATVTLPMFYAQTSGAMGKPGMDVPSAHKVETLPQAMSFAQTRIRPFLKRQWSEDLSISAVSHKQQQIELSSPSTEHAYKLPFTTFKTDLTKREVPVLRRSISSSQDTLKHTALTSTALTRTTPPDGQESGPVDLRTRIRDGSTKSEGNSPLEGSNKPPIGSTRVATTTAGGVAMEMSSRDEDARAKRRRNEKSFHPGKF